MSSKRKRHTAEQIIGKLREADIMLANGSSLGQVCQKLEVSEQSYYRWKSKYGGMKTGEAKRLKAVEDENARLKKLVADLSLDNAILKEVIDGIEQGKF